MVINNLEKLFVTNDAATILRQLEVGIFFFFLKWGVVAWIISLQLMWMRLFITGPAPSR